MAAGLSVLKLDTFKGETLNWLSSRVCLHMSAPTESFPCVYVYVDKTS